MTKIDIQRGVSFMAVLALLAALMTVLAVSPVAAGGTTATLSASLSGDQEVPPVTTAATGTAEVTIDSAAAADNQLCYDVTSTDLEGGAVVGAHIHEGAAGANGPVVVTLQAVIDGDGTGAACATDAEIDYAAAGDADIATFLADLAANPANYYVNVHTTDIASGEIRGQLEVAGGGEPETGMLMIMKHYCNADDSNPETTVDVRSEEEFMEVEAGGGGNEVIAVALTILACPVERLPGDAPAPDSIAHFEEEFEFLVTDSTGATFTLADATFNQALVCEQDKEVASGPDPIVIGEVDGDEATNVCVDFSFYSIDGVAEGEVTVVETFHEGEHEFGTVRFTPAALDPDDDSRTLVGFDRPTSTVNIDTSLDDNAMVMLHIYNFDTAAAAPAPSVPAASMLPDAAVNAPGTFDSNGIAILFGIVALASMGFLGLRTAAVRRDR